MRAISTLLLIALLGECWGGRAQCVGAEKQLQAISSALATENTDKAEDLLDDLQASHPDCDEVVLDRGRSLYLRGQTARAEQTLLNFVQARPDDARGYAYLALLLLDHGELERADAASTLALEKNPDEPAAVAVRGQLLGMKGQTEEGIAQLERACRLDPANADALYQLGKLYQTEVHRMEAATAFEKSLSLVPGNADAWDYLALDLEPLGQPDRADEAYRKGEAVNGPGRHYDGFLDYNYGRLLAKRNQPKEAKEHLSRAVELSPDVRAVWYERAKVNLSLKAYAEARTDAEKAASLPDTGGVILDLQIYTLLQQIYTRLGETGLANKYAELSRKTRVPMQQSR